MIHYFIASHFNILNLEIFRHMDYRLGGYMYTIWLVRLPGQGTAVKDHCLQLFTLDSCLQLSTGKEAREVYL